MIAKQTSAELNAENKKLRGEIKKLERKIEFGKNLERYEIALLRQQNSMLKLQLCEQNEFIGKKWGDDPTHVPATMDDAAKMLHEATGMGL